MSFQSPAIGSRNLAREPRLTIRLLPQMPEQMTNISPPVTPNELVGVFNGIDGTMRLFVTSGDGTAYLAVSAA